ncbi:MAG TPA: VIT and VWA domain-containing protein [Longimicrobiaceae bacterium]|nr:VIT and VWA domain-containing protein [Longimicrobiaceae bacterium]
MRFQRLLPAFLALAAAAPLAAQGTIVPECRDCRRPWVPGGRPLTALPIESVEIATRIDGQVATTHVTQVFRNETDATLEGTYFFPIPSGASVSEFAIWDGNRRLVGEVRPREEARRIYDAIVRRVRDPGLLEYAGENLFQASIFPILPRSTKKLELTYTQVLRAENGTVGYRYPLGTGRNAAPIERVSGRVELRANEPVRTVYSPSHAVDVSRRDGDRRVAVSFESARGAERRDFQLFYAPSAREVGMSLFTYREPGKDGYFLLLLSPRSTIEDREYAAKDVVFVLDISGSMNEEGKMDKARRALVHGVRGLRATDRFNVIAFSGETRLMESGLIRADEAGRRRGVQFVEGLRAVGGTNINDALVEALGQFPREGTRPRLLVFLTDGLPTVGETNVEGIMANVRRARREGLRLFSFGVGYDVNTRLLDRVAAENGGVADYVDPREDLEVKVSNFFDKVNHPVLTNLQLDLGPVRSDLTYPRTLPDLFKGTQLALVGRYRNERDLAGVTVRLSGNASPTQTFTYPGQRFPLRDERHEWLPRLWATRRVGWLMEQVRSHGENRELREEIVELGTRYGIVTPYTSYLALEPGAEREFAQGGRANGVVGSGGALRRDAPPPPAPVARAADAQAVTGQVAVDQSRASRGMQEAVSLEGLSTRGREAGIQRVGEKTFYLRSGVWTDSEIRDGTRLPETTLTFGTDEYFELLRRTPELGRYFALGERVAVIHAGRIYRTRPANP